MLHSEKIQVVETLTDKFGRAPLAIVADYRGLTVAEMTALRNKVREADGEFLVAKNTLARIAVRDTGCAAVAELLAGPNAFALAYSDPIALAKAVSDFAKDNDKLELKGGVLEGELMGAESVQRLAKMPGRDELRAKLLALLNTPATQLVRVLNAPAQQLAQVLGARKSQLEEQA
jgi:large subunit ribosomal protein L10